MTLSIHKKLLLNLLLLFWLSMLSGCATRPPALPEAHADKLPWGAIDLDIRKSGASTIKASLGGALIKKANDHSNSNETVPFNILTLSGGGTRGAFGAGLLSGWTDRGDIPEFDIVTGVSTGAVMATFVFLGGVELEKVKAFYTKMYTKDIYTRSWLSFIGEAYLMNPAPLKKLFSNNFNEALLKRVAAEHAKGRRLYIGTTNIDTGQQVVWDMGAIASSNRSDKYQRFSDIIYASSALPIFLPPQYISVDIGNEKYYQMHVDGGIYSHVFMIGLFVNWEEVLKFRGDANLNFDTTLYTIANRKYRNRTMYDPVEQSPSSVIAALLETEVDLLFDRSMYRLYDSCIQKGIKFRMAAVPKDVNHVDISTEFNPVKMLKLFNVGYGFGLKGVEWQDHVSIDEYDNR
ncbi:MAG: patatin-like phospholipase family protein [Gammaproteobacteria bacterium]